MELKRAATTTKPRYFLIFFLFRFSSALFRPSLLWLLWQNYNIKYLFSNFIFLHSLMNEIYPLQVPGKGTKIRFKTIYVHISTHTLAHRTHFIIFNALYSIAFKKKIRNKNYIMIILLKFLHSFYCVVQLIRWTHSVYFAHFHASTRCGNVCAVKDIKILKNIMCLILSGGLVRVVVHKQ